MPRPLPVLFLFLAFLMFAPQSAVESEPHSTDPCPSESPSCGETGSGHPPSFGIRVFPTYDVRSFGAVADDGKSDRAAINAAINALPPGGGTVVIKGGRFRVDLDADSRGIILSDGTVLPHDNGNTILRVQKSATLYLADRQTAGSRNSGLIFSVADRLTVTGRGRIDGNERRNADVSTNFGLINISGGNHVTIENLSLINSPGLAVRVGGFGSKNLTIRNFYLANTMDGMTINHATNTLIRDGVIVNTRTHNADAIEFEGADTFTVRHVYARNIEDAFIDILPIYEPTSRFGKIIDNEIHRSGLSMGTGSAAITLNADTTLVARNSFYEPGHGGALDCREGGDNHTATGNRFVNNRIVGSHERGMRVRAAGCTIVGNEIIRSDSEGILVTASGATIRANRFHNNNQSDREYAELDLKGSGNRIVRNRFHKTNPGPIYADETDDRLIENEVIR